MNIGKDDILNQYKHFEIDNRNGEKETLTLQTPNVEQAIIVVKALFGYLEYTTKAFEEFETTKDENIGKQCAENIIKLEEYYKELTQTAVFVCIPNTEEYADLTQKDMNVLIKLDGGYYNSPIVEFCYDECVRAISVLTKSREVK